jgi:hypothetical protein
VYGAALFPGTVLIDQEFVPAPGEGPPVEGNIAVATTCLALLATGVGLSRSGRRPGLSRRTRT